jgi:AcrR family transcriptional regulator
MSIVVQHEKRRKEILEKALAVFIDEGFEDTTFQRIADRCNITRTTLYLYFKNKKEIFSYSIRQMLISLEENINTIREDTSQNSVDKLTKVLLAIFKLLEQNRRLLSVVADYLSLLPNNDNNTPEKRIRRRTVKLRHILSSIIIQGIKDGELKKTNIKNATDYLYNIVMSSIFYLVVLRQKDLGVLKDIAAFAVKQLAV